MRSFLTVITMLTLGLAAKANDPYFEISKVEVQQIEVTQQDLLGVGIGAQACQDGITPSGEVITPVLPVNPANPQNPNPGANPNPANPANPLDETNLIVDQIINIGKKIWAVVETGRPVVNIKTDVATALPAGSRCWNDLQAWSRPETRVFAVKVVNGYGIDVIKFNYRVSYLTGGTVNGIGKYIGYAAIEPAELSVAWGYTFSASAHAPTVFNMGTKADPLAGMQIQVKYSVDTVMKHTEITQAYFITGAGQFEALK